MNACRGCGAEFTNDVPTPDRCGDCPPQQCPDCGQLDSSGQPCPCWVSLEGMGMAELKGWFARADLSLGVADRNARGGS